MQLPIGYLLLPKSYLDVNFAAQFHLKYLAAADGTASCSAAAAVVVQS